MWDLETDESRLNKRYHLEAYTHLHAQGRIERVLRLGASWNTLTKEQMFGIVTE